jgi:3-hydroxyanthranilate 3,4-dioxygenase
MIVTALPKVYQDYHDDMEARKCAHCGEIHPGKGKPPAGWVQLKA